MPPKRQLLSDAKQPAKRRKTTIATEPSDVLGRPGSRWEAWPAPSIQIERARAFVRDCALGQHPTLLVPDKDADGLRRTLMLLGLTKDKIHLHMPKRGVGLFSEDHRSSLDEIVAFLGGPEDVRVIILDQGSRPGQALVQNCPYLILDHHVSQAWPEGAVYVTGCDAQPVPTSSLLAYVVCYTLHPKVPFDCAWPALIGVFGDLGSAEARFGEEEGGWPLSQEMLELAAASKRATKKDISSAVSLLNAPRRTAEFNVIDAWNALVTAHSPSDISNNATLKLARVRVSSEAERCVHTAPKFSKDGRVALLRIDSAFQVHPLVATTWSNSLRAKKLEMVMCANPGHHPDPNIISFSCRIAQQMRRLPPNERPNLIELLREYARKTSDTFLADVGGDFASGHREATGGIINKDLFEALVNDGMQIGVKADVDPNATPKTKQIKMEEGQQMLSHFFSTPKSAKCEASSPLKNISGDQKVDVHDNPADQKVDVRDISS